ncbi:MAG: DNRLRE domain-containing protein [Eubacterium sp.]
MKNNKIGSSKLKAGFAIGLMVMLLVTSLAAEGITNKIKADTNEVLKNNGTAYTNIEGKVITWLGTLTEMAIVSSSTFTCNVNMNITGPNFYVSDSYYTYGPYQNEKKYAYINMEKLDSGTTDSLVLQGLENAYIEYASITFTEYGDCDKPGIVVVKSPKSSWLCSTLTWNNQPEIDEKEWGSAQCSGISGSKIEIDITEWARNVVSGTVENNGLVLMQKNRGTMNGFYGFKHTDESNYPEVCIQYRTIVNN